jgi:hypothetical protein
MSRGGVTVKHIALALIAVAACTTEPPPPEGEQVTSYVDTHIIPMSFNSQVDILFVIDSSPAMAAAQQKLVADYRAMIETLSHSSVGELPDVRIGVVTADAVDQGRLRRDAILADSPRFAWRREKNYDGPLADAFVPLATVGASGHTAVQPLDAVLRALSPSVNPGFVRKDAYLAVIVLTAGDDQSTTAINDAAHALKSLKSDPSKVVIGLAAGACSDGGITATAAPRLAAFADQFPNRNTRVTLCDDLTPLAAIAGQLLKSVLGQPCIEEKLAEPLECNAWLADPTSDDSVLMPACSAANPDRCWELRSDPQNCPFVAGQSLHLKPFIVPFPATLMFECVAE